MTKSTNLTIEIYGMECEGCVNSVLRAIKKVNGVQDATVSLEQSNARVTFDSSVVADEGIQQAITDAGFEVGP